MKAILLLMALGMGGLLYVQWEIAPEQAPPLPPQSDATPEQEEAPESAATDRLLGDPQSYEVISQRPLFVEGRRPPEEAEQQAPAPEQAGAVEGLDFSAVLITPEQKIAWVKDAATGELVRLEPGKKIRGWTVQEVHPQRLLLADGEKKNELELREFPVQAAAAQPSPMRPLQPGARRPATRPLPSQQTRTQQTRTPRTRPPYRTPRR